MDKFNLIKQTIKGEPTEKVPYAIWKHFPEFDKSPEQLLKAQMKFQKEFDSDIMKISISSRAFAYDFGVKVGGYNPVTGSRTSVKYPIEKLEDWNNIKKIDVRNGEFGNQIKAMKLISREVEGKVPTMMTIFSPFLVASEIDQDVIKHYRKNPELIKEKLNIIASAMTDFTEASLDAGANGIFLGTQHFNNRLNDEERMVLEFNPMKTLITKTIKKSNFVVLHLHGDLPDFELATKLPIDAINWHDQQTLPNLTEARKMFKGGLLGGLNTNSWKELSHPENVSPLITSMYNNFKGNGLIISPGCVIPLYISNIMIKTVVNTIRNLK